MNPKLSIYGCRVTITCARRCAANQSRDHKGGRGGGHGGRISLVVCGGVKVRAVVEAGSRLDPPMLRWAPMLALVST